MNNKKEKIIDKRVYTYIIAFIILLFITIMVMFLLNKNKSNSSSNEGIEYMYYQDDNIVDAVVKPFVSEKTAKVTINNVEYELILDNNLAAFDLLSILPIKLEMDDLNNNEKYSYLPFSLTNDDNYSGTIKKGDVMLYQSNCVVIFYKDFETTEYYTKIGYIEGLPDFGNETITVDFDKE